MIDQNTTQVYVRVDLASRRVISVSDQPLADRPGRPVFTVSANHAKLEYYVIVDNPAAAYGITVRAATAEEITAADAASANIATAVMSRAKFQKAFAIKEFYDEIYIRRFLARGFMTTTETMSAAIYSGTNQHMLDTVKPLAIQISIAYNEWRHTVCQPVIDTMLAGSGLGPDLDSEYRSTVEDELDTFLTGHGFDINVYHR